MRSREQLLDTTTNLFFRELKLRYAGYVLGPVWIILYPLAFTLLTTMVFSFVFKGYESGTPYFLFVMSGFIHWILFNQSIGNATKSLVINRTLIINNKFPTESLVIAAILVKVVDYLINLFVIFVLMYIFHQSIYPISLFYIALILPCQIIIQYGLGLFAALLNVYYRDTQNIVDIILQLLFYATPIIYPLSVVPRDFQWIILINPLARLITAIRQALFYQNFDIQFMLMLYVFAFVLLTAAMLTYKRYEQRFADRI